MAKAAVDKVAPYWQWQTLYYPPEKIYAPVPRNGAKPAQYSSVEWLPKMLIKVQDKEQFSLSDVRRLTRLGMGPCVPLHLGLAYMWIPTEAG